MVTGVGMTGWPDDGFWIATEGNLATLSLAAGDKQAQIASLLNGQVERVGAPGEHQTRTQVS